MTNQIGDILLKSLIKFYEQGDRLDRLLDILKYKKSVSLRLIDWFTTNFSKSIIYFTSFIRTNKVTKP